MPWRASVFSSPRSGRWRHPPLYRNNISYLASIAPTYILAMRPTTSSGPSIKLRIFLFLKCKKLKSRVTGLKTKQYELLRSPLGGAHQGRGDPQEVPTLGDTYRGVHCSRQKTQTSVNAELDRSRGYRIATSEESASLSVLR